MYVVAPNRVDLSYAKGCRCGVSVFFCNPRLYAWNAVTNSVEQNWIFYRFAQFVLFVMNANNQRKVAIIAGENAIFKIA